MIRRRRDEEDRRMRGGQTWGGVTRWEGSRSQAKGGQGNENLKIRRKTCCRREEKKHI